MQGGGARSWKQQKMDQRMDFDCVAAAVIFRHPYPGQDRWDHAAQDETEYSVKKSSFLSLQPGPGYAGSGA